MKRIQKTLKVIFSPKREAAGIVLFDKRSGGTVVCRDTNDLLSVEFDDDWGYEFYVAVGITTAGKSDVVKMPLSDVGFMYRDYIITANLAFEIIEAQEKRDVTNTLRWP